MHDILPKDLRVRRILEAKIANILNSYGYHPIQLSIVERKELFTEGLGYNTAIVNKEMYELYDRNGDLLVLRPEGTTSCLRAVLEHQLISPAEELKVWYCGPMFRYERPQRGRYREFYQIGIESFNFDPLLQEAENIMLVWHIWQSLGLSDHVVLHINNLGSYQDREKYSLALKQYMQQFIDKLSQEEIFTLSHNPIRIMDSKNVKLSSIIAAAPKLESYISSLEDRNHFIALINYLNQHGVPYMIDSRLVRGLDYYSQTVFEWMIKTEHILGAQSTICAGGRYNDLVSRFSNKQSFNAFGCAIGVERLTLALQNLNLSPTPNKTIDIYLILNPNFSYLATLSLFYYLIKAYPTLTFKLSAREKSLKNQLERAYDMKAKFILAVNSEDMAVIRLIRVQDRSTINMDLIALGKLLKQEFKLL